MGELRIPLGRELQINGHKCRVSRQYFFEVGLTPKSARLYLVHVREGKDDLIEEKDIYMWPISVGNLPSLEEILRVVSRYPH